MTIKFCFSSNPSFWSKIYLFSFLFKVWWIFPRNNFHDGAKFTLASKFIFSKHFEFLFNFSVLTKKHNKSFINKNLKPFLIYVFFSTFRCVNWKTITIKLYILRITFILSNSPTVPKLNRTYISLNRKRGSFFLDNIISISL